MSQSWKVAYVSTIILKATSVGDLEFDLDNVRGRVVTSEEVTIPTSQTVVVKRTNHDHRTSQACLCAHGITS